tara:strand:+ start:509 stop:703 length:195 start_codon:yes stop_codon:yes gene_type:complete
MVPAKGENMKRWEITFIDNGNTVVWSTRKANKYFGKAEFNEMRQGYAPHIVVAEVIKGRNDWGE